MSNPSYKLSNRVLAMALAILLVLGMAPIPVWAVGSTVTTDLTTQTVVTGEYTEFTVTTVANDHADTMVLGYFDFNDGDWSVIDSLQYKESTDDQWYDLPQDTPFGPSGTGFPMSDATSTFRVNFNTVGTYSFSISMKTVSDSTELCSLSGSVTVSDPSSDTTPPTVDSVSGNPTDWVQSATISVTASDADSGVEKVVYSTNSTYSDSYSSATLENGTYNFEVSENGTYYVWAVDGSGNVSDAEEIVVDKIDTTAPTIGNVILDPDSWTNGTVQVSIEVTDSDSGVSNVHYSKVSSSDPDAKTATDGGNGSWTFNIDEATDGTYTYYIWAVDKADNKSETEVTVYVDKTAPTIAITSQSSSGWTNGDVTISGTVQDSGSGVTKVVMGTSDVYDDASDKDVIFDATVGTYSFTVSENDTYYIWAVDNAENHSDPTEVEITCIDKEAPTVNAEPDTDVWTSGDVTISGTASDVDSGVAKVVMGTTNDYTAASDADITFDASTGTYSFTVAENGTYYIWAVDNAENHSDPTEVEITCIDKEAPTANAEPDTDVWTSGDVTISGTASDVGSGVTKVVMGTTDDYSAASDADVTFNASTGTYSFTVAGNGDYYVWAVDKVGNYSSMVTVTIGNIDKVAPTGSITIKQSTWDALLSALTFGLFTNEKFDVSVSAEDITSPLIIQYYKVVGDDAAKLLSWDDLDDVSDWTTVDLNDGTSKVNGETILTVDTDTQFVVYVKIADSAGNYTYASTDGAIVDKTDAGITLTPLPPAADNGYASVYGYYNSDVTIDIAAADSAPYSGIKSIEYWITMDGEKGATETLYSFGYDGSYDADTQWTITGSDIASENGPYTGIPTRDMLKSEWSGEITVSAADYNSSDVVVNVKVMDNAGNESTESVKLDIDYTNPEISISYDDNSPINETYFSATRTATIVITERDNHFVEPTVYVNEEAPADATNYISIQAVDANGEAVTNFDPTIIWTTDIDTDDPDKTTHTAAIAYDADANYTFSISYSDKATNDAIIDTGDSAALYAFTVDTTVPTGSTSIGENIWAELLEKLTFGLFTNDEFDVVVSAEDATSPLIIQYYKVAGDDAATLLSRDDLDAVSGWTLLTDNGASSVADLYTLTVSEDEQFVVYFKLTDYAGNYNYICTDGAIVDHTVPVVDDPAPEITITPEQPVNGFYNGDVKVSIQVTDPTYGETFSGLNSVSYKVFNMGQVTQEGTLYTFAETISTSDHLPQIWTGSITVDSELNNSNDVTIEVYAQDNALNTSSNSVGIQIDVTAPKIDIQYDNNDVDSGTYYKANRTATIVVTERNFRAEDVSVTITNTDGTIPTISDWTVKQGTGNGDDTTYTATILYNADGDYTFAIAYTDLANNVCTEINSASTNPYAFTIDKTAPTITVTYDNNTAVNDIYFSATRTATITIIEHNFDVNRVVFTQGAARGGETPNPVWANNGDVHVATISYTVDGDYTFDVTMTDLAGNISGTANYGNSVAGQAFTLDTTFEDMIAIIGVANGVAYGHNADIIPSLSISDINLSGYTVTLVGVQKDQTIDLTDEVNQLLDAGVETVTGIFDIFEIRQDLDGIYMLTVTSEDSAGNTDSEEVVFTVNRYGSVYVYSQYLMDLIADGGCYVQSIGEDLVIDEYNADRLLSGSLVIEITVDGRPLENVEYTVTPEINDTVAVGESGWYQYRYTISKENFTEDGVYKISVSSQDATGNSPENTNYEGMEMTFRVDSTSPEITSIVGLEESIINAQEVTVKYTVFDTIGLKSVKVYVNDELIDEIADFSSDMNNFSSQFTLTEQTNAQTVRIIVEDMSGNITDTSAEDFTSAYAFNRIVTVSTNIFVRWYANKPLFWGSIAGVVVLVGGICILAAYKRKKKEKAGE